MITPDREMLVRGIGRIESSFQGKGSAKEQLQKSTIKAINGTPILLDYLPSGVRSAIAVKIYGADGKTADIRSSGVAR